MIRAIFVVFLIGLAVLLFVNRADSILGADATGYASLARMLERGETVRPTPFLCAECEPFWSVPIGFVTLPGRPEMASLYPVGLPLHLLAAAKIGGWSAGPYFVNPIAALLILFCTFWLGRRLHSELAGLIAAVLMGLCAVFLMQAVQTMSDVLAAAWCVAAVTAAVEARQRPSFAVLAGFAFGMAVLVRPTSALMLLPLAFALWPDRSLSRSGSSTPLRAVLSRSFLQSLLLFGLGGVPTVIVFGWYNLATFGSLLASGYSVSGASGEFALSYFPARALHYLRWTVEQFSPVTVVAAFAGLFLLARRERWMLGTWLAAFYLCYSFYYSYDEWWYTRFLIPAYPALAVAAGVAFARLVAMRRVLGVAAIILVAAWELRQMVRFSVFYTDEDQARYRVLPEWAARSLPPRSLVFSFEFSGPLDYYSDHIPVRWDLAPPDRALAFARSRSEPVYALLMDHELTPFRTKYGDAFRRVRSFSGGALFLLEK